MTVKFHAFLLIFAGFVCHFSVSSIALAETAADYQTCIVSKLGTANTYDDVQGFSLSCGSTNLGDISISDRITIIDAIATGWCRGKTDKCTNDALGCKLKLDECKNLPTVDCGSGLDWDASQNACVCPVTKKLALRSSECTPNPVVCATGLESKNGKCVCPGKTQVAASLLACNKPDEEDPEFTQTQANRNLADVAALQGKADQCCHNPATCGAPLKTAVSDPAPGQGMLDFCAQMQNASAENADANSKASSACYSSFHTCTASAQQQIKVYQEFAADCGECSVASIYSATLTKLQAMNDSCNGLSALATALGRQQVASGAAAGQSSICKTSGGNYKSQSATGTPQSTSFDASVCHNNPRAPGCGSATQESQAAARGNDGFIHGDKENKNFNPAAISDYGSPITAVQAGANSKADHPTIPNGSGAGMFGSQDPGGGAQGDAKKVAVTATGSQADIFQGMRSGGYSPTPGSPDYDFYNRTGIRPANTGKKVDLKKLMLPGQNFRLPAGNSGNATDHILGKFEDIWQHIRDRMQEKCKLGVLDGCHDK